MEIANSGANLVSWYCRKVNFFSKSGMRLGGFLQRTGVDKISVIRFRGARGVGGANIKNPATPLAPLARRTTVLLYCAVPTWPTGDHDSLRRGRATWGQPALLLGAARLRDSTPAQWGLDLQISCAKMHRSDAQGTG